MDVEWPRLIYRVRNWRTLLMILIALMAGELILSGLISKQRFGSESIAETTEDWRQQAGRVALIGRPQEVAAAKENQSGAGTEEKEVAQV